MFGILYSDQLLLLFVHDPWFQIWLCGALLTESRAKIASDAQPVRRFESEIAMRLTGWGFGGTNVMERHIELPAVSDNTADFLSTAIMRGSSLPEKTRTHGTYLIISNFSTLL
ncbi:hypothetical protein CHS0354_041234 [Potamilus streckersoni]|uniref:Uncharacterized protein n=1 Tax=Potamilus streckersoni TaxID=2493646 RepID=A0AAE0SEE6_9BIVA|nr:hypothetical protein CHS0354_041234 [Potamilus streckersoni]